MVGLFINLAIGKPLRRSHAAIISANRRPGLLWRLEHADYPLSVVEGFDWQVNKQIAVFQVMLDL